MSDHEVSRDERTVWRLVASDIDAVAGRELTDDELDFVARALDNSTVNECVIGAVDQIPGHLDDEDDGPGVLGWDVMDPEVGEVWNTDTEMEDDNA
jgi:hypothetical protein